MTDHRPHRSPAVTAVLAICLGLVLATLAVPSAPAGAADRPTYVNPVSKDFADTFADPAVVRGKDGWWYAYGTSDPLREGEETAHRIPIARLPRPRRLGSTSVTRSRRRRCPPGRPRPTAPAIWAPDVRYVDGQWRHVLRRHPDDGHRRQGRQRDRHGHRPVPRRPVDRQRRPGGRTARAHAGSNDFLWTFDPSVVTDRDGSQWIFYGSYNGGVFVAPLDDAGRTVTGAATMVAIDNKFEGAYVVRHGGYWYLFASTANCCAGPTTGYSVQVGRSTDLRGPYVDEQGQPLVASRAGGTPVLYQNGNRWIGAGHNAIARDVDGPRLDRLPRDRPRRPLPRRALRHQRAADAARPAGLGRRLAGRARGPRPERRIAARSADRRLGGRPVRPHGRRRPPARSTARCGSRLTSPAARPSSPAGPGRRGRSAPSYAQRRTSCAWSPRPRGVRSSAARRSRPGWTCPSCTRPSSRCARAGPPPSSATPGSATRSPPCRCGCPRVSAAPRAGPVPCGSARPPRSAT